MDLAIEVADPSGRRTSGRLIGTGHRLRMEVTDPAVVVAAAGRGAAHLLGVGSPTRAYGPSSTVPAGGSR